MFQVQKKDDEKITHQNWLNAIDRYCIIFQQDFDSVIESEKFVGMTDLEILEYSEKELSEMIEIEIIEQSELNISGVVKYIWDLFDENNDNEPEIYEIVWSLIYKKLDITESKFSEMSGNQLTKFLEFDITL